MADPTALALATKVTEALVDLAKGKLGEVIADKLKEHSPTERLKAAREVDAHEWQLQRLLALGEHVQALKAGAQATGETLAKFEELLADPQFWRLQHNYQFEAGREAMDERRRMLSFASAGSFNVELTLAEIARVERATRSMDPTDVLNLADMIGTIKSGDGPISSKQTQDALDLLLALGCIRFPPGQTRREGIITGERPRMGTGGQPIIPSQPHVTQLGLKISNVMRGYVNAVKEAAPRQAQR